MKPDEKQIFNKVYRDYYLMHPDSDPIPKSKFYYLHRQWFFPGHIDLVLENIKVFHSKYYPHSKLSVALFAGLLHDAGLVYKRTEASPEGHENRSCEYARKKLKSEGFSESFISNVCKAIKATDSESKPTSGEPLLVRNADAYSHLTSIHFFAKAYFSDDVEYFIEWFAKKIEATFGKLTIPELIKELKPQVESYRKMIQIYRAHSGKKFNL